MPICITNATLNHIDSLVKIFNEIVYELPYYNEMAKKGELAKYNQDELHKKISEDPTSVIIALENNEIIGFCYNRFDDMTVWLEWFGVIDEARRNGLGKRIIEYLEINVREKKLHKIWCDCRTENLKSIKVLSACGYTPICTIKNHWYKQDFILWQKEII
jgi:RimJ/RimL family protein N-acetyltransferase